MGSRRKSLRGHPVGAKLAPEHPLYDVVERAYTVFDRPKPETLGVCRYCCMEFEIETDFLTPDIRELPLAYVRDWFFAAAEPPIPKSVWVYLLPRVFEILADGKEDPSSVGLEVSLARFPTGDPDMWSAEQWAAIDAFKTLYLDRAASPEDGLLDDVLCMFGEAGFDLDALLAQVWGWDDATLTERLWHDWCQNSCDPSIWITAFWSEARNSRVFAWYTSRALCDRMLAFACAETTDAEMADKALAVAAVIERFAD